MVRKIKLKDPISSITHYIGAVLSVGFGLPLIVKGFNADINSGLASLVFIMGMIMLYSASGTYHAISSSAKVNRILKKLDHCMIFVLIASSYTPICLIAIDNLKGYIMLGVVWGIAVIGIIIKMIVIYHPKWISSVLYIGMGWVCIFLVKDIYIALEWQGFFLLLLGGIMYTIGGVIYALKLKVFNSRNSLWGSHEIFHIFVMLGSAFHYLVIYFFVLK